MIDERDIVRRAAEQLTPPGPPFERLLRRRDRKRRSQRITAGVVGVAVFVAAVWIVTTGGPFDRTQTPGAPGGAVTGPTETGPAVAADGPGLVGLAPEGATPSSPITGELVLSAFFGHSGGDPGRFHFNVYADGRLIWQRLGGGTHQYAIDYTTGWVEQRLTPEGVELLRSEALSTGLFDHDAYLAGGYVPYFGEVGVLSGDRLVRVTWGDCCDPSSREMAEERPTQEQASALERLDSRLADPASWLPASAWEDQEITAFVPSGYSVCYDAAKGIELDRVLATFPRPAEDLLRSWERTRWEWRDPREGSFTFWCSDVTTEEARTLARILDDSGAEHREDIFEVRYELGQRDPDAVKVSLSFALLLPHEM